MHKAGKYESAERVNKIIELLVSGVSSYKIVRYCAEKLDWGVSDRQIEKYKTKAIKYLEKIAIINREKQIGLALRRYEQAVKMAISKDSPKQLVVAQRALCDLLGLNAPARHEVTGKDGDPIEIKKKLDLSQFTDEELALIESVGIKLAHKNE